MGNSASTRNLFPKSLIECIDSNGSLDPELYYIYRQHKRQKQSNEDMDAIINQAISESGEENTINNPRIKRHCFRKKSQFTMCI
jgi:hypothetical protein